MTALFACLFAQVPARSTTVVIIVTPESIIIGADGRTTITTGTRQTRGSDTAKKLGVVQKRLVVASVGLERAGDGAVYDFAAWLSKIGQSLPDNIPVDDFASVIERESARTFNGFDAILKNGIMTRTHALEDSTALVDYVIAGYKNNTPMVFVIHFYVDWETQTLIGPKKIVMHPSPIGREDFGIYSFGFNWAINNLTHPDSYAFKRALELAPLETRTALANKDLTAKQAKLWTRVLIDIEKEVEPYVVGGDTMIAQIPVDGTATSVEYQKGRLLPVLGRRSEGR